MTDQNLNWSSLIALAYLWYCEIVSLTDLPPKGLNRDRSAGQSDTLTHRLRDTLLPNLARPSLKKCLIECQIFPWHPVAVTKREELKGRSK